MPKNTKDAKKAAEKAATKGKVHLLILIDESGSMNGNEEAVVSGVNEFITRFKKESKDSRATIAWFDDCPGEDQVRFKVKGEKISKVSKLTAADYNPRGMTPLNDAVIQTVKQGEKTTKDGERVFMVILTDGLENASEASSEAVAKIVKKKEKDDWGFLYIGANQNAGKAGAAIGLRKAGQTVAFKASRRGTSNALRSASNFGIGYFRAPDSNVYLDNAAQALASTGGMLKEDEELQIKS